MPLVVMVDWMPLVVVVDWMPLVVMVDFKLSSDAFVCHGRLDTVK